MITNITWSVAIEEQYYLAWPLFFAVLPLRFYKLIFPAIILMSAIFRFFYAGDGQVLYFHTLSVISDMAMGGLSAYLSLRSPAFRLAIGRLPRPAIGAIYGFGLLIFLFPHYIQNELLSAVLGRLVASLVFALILLEQNFSHRSLWKMKNLRLFTALGKYTYGLYLLHPIALGT